MRGWNVATDSEIKEFGHKINSARRFAAHGHWAGAIRTLDLLKDIQEMLDPSHETIAMGLRGVAFSIGERYDDALRCFHEALSGDISSDEPTVARAQTSLDFAICLLRRPGTEAQMQVSRDKAHRAITLSMAIYEYLGHKSSAEFIIANGFRGYSIGGRNSVESTSVMQAARRLMAEVIPVGEPSLAALVHDSDPAVWLYGCRALIGETIENGCTRYSVVLSDKSTRTFVTPTIY